MQTQLDNVRQLFDGIGDKFLDHLRSLFLHHNADVFKDPLNDRQKIFRHRHSAAQKVCNEFRHVGVFIAKSRDKVVIRRFHRRDRALNRRAGFQLRRARDAHFRLHGMDSVNDVRVAVDGVVGVIALRSI